VTGSPRKNAVRVIRELRRWRSTWYIARQLGISQRTVQRIIREMADEGISIEVRKDEHTPEYRAG
jgi:biotin operon repressor